jgi:hypothetical protein
MILYQDLPHAEWIGPRKAEVTTDYELIVTPVLGFFENLAQGARMAVDIRNAEKTHESTTLSILVLPR